MRDLKQVQPNRRRLQIWKKSKKHTRQVEVDSNLLFVCPNRDTTNFNREQNLGSSWSCKSKCNEHHSGWL